MGLHRGNKHRSAVAVIAEHVQAGASRAEQHSIAGLGLGKAPGHSGLKTGMGLAGHGRGGRVGRQHRVDDTGSRQIKATARANRAIGLASGQKSWPLPSPPRITASLLGALSAPSPSSAATVAPTLVPLLSS